MPETTSIAIFAQNEAQAAYLKEVVAVTSLTFENNVGAAGIVLVAGAGFIPGEGQMALWLETGSAAPEGVRLVKTPLRAASLVEILKRAFLAQTALPPKIGIADATLDTRDNLWLRSGAEAVRLTEKETAILAYLKDSGGSPVTREDLLGRVWAYAEGVETHTLETHIYRLRQKIEKDPSRPEILITIGDGYTVKC